jgi:TolA-binding protein
MISAFKHIRLSGYNLIPQNVNGNTRITLNNSGVAYYSELTGVSGYLQNLIDNANADVSSINGLQNAVNVTGRNGIQIFVEGQNIVVSGNDSAVQSSLANLGFGINSVANNLFLTGSGLDAKINSLSGYSNSTFATITNLASTGSTLQTNINTVATNLATTGATLSSSVTSLSGYSNNTFATITNLAATGSNLQGQISSLSGAFVTFTGNLAAEFTTDAELLAASGVLSSRIAATGSTLQSSINSLSGYSNSTFATITNLAATGSTLNTKIDNLSGYSNNTFATITNLAATGSTLNSRINSLSGTLTSDYVQKATQQQFIVTLPTNIESTGITFPIAFASTPNSVQVTFEPSTDVTYMVAVKNRTTAGFTAEFSDVIFEAGNKLNVFASI